MLLTYYIILVEWTSSNWTLTGIKEVQENLEDVCSIRTPGLTLMGNPLNYENSFKTCKMFDSKYGVCSSRQTDVAMVNIMINSSSIQCKSSGGFYWWHWCGFNDIQEENVWRDPNNNEIMPRHDAPWHKSEPNGREFENCVEHRITEQDDGQIISTWNDEDCEDSDDEYQVT